MFKNTVFYTFYTATRRVLLEVHTLYTFVHDVVDYVNSVVHDAVYCVNSGVQCFAYFKTSDRVIQKYLKSAFSASGKL